jgi:histidyl-tRNA synthetase
MKKADASGAPCALIVGEEEVAAGEVSVKALRESGQQSRATLSQLGERIAAILQK